MKTARSARRLLCTLAVGAGILAGERGAAAARTWCSTAFPDAVFCDDFDRYCSNPPPAPEACTGGADGSILWQQWKPTGPCMNPIGLDSLYAISPPWGARTNTQDASTLGLAKHAFSDAIRAKYGEAYSSMVGTDLNPLVLEVVMQASRAQFDNTYLSFGSGAATAPVDFAWSPYCGCDSPEDRYPIVCAQDPVPANCPAASTRPLVPCIAVGFVSYLDSDPCECSGSQHSPLNEQLSFYDGFAWHRLRQGLFPGTGDFKLRTGPNWIKITIRFTTMTVELTNPQAGEYSRCEMPRHYLGPFNSMMIGYGIACHLKTGSWECRNDPYDPVCLKGAPQGSVPYYDNLVVHGGTPATGPGACCFPNTSCTTVQEGGDCTVLGGIFAGPGSTCQETACCPPFKPDHDMDQDVDVSDFGWFQTCLSTAPYEPPPTVACRCADLDGDNDVDAADLNWFYDCLGGPQQPVGAGCPGG